MFHNLPVRRKSMDINGQKEKCILLLQRLSLAYPSIQFLLKDEDCGAVIFNSTKFVSIPAKIKHNFDVTFPPDAFEDFQLEQENLEISGWICSPLKYLHPNKNLQFLCNQLF